MTFIPAPLRLRPFRRLILAYGVNALGTWLAEIALAVLVLQETGSAAAVSAVWLAGQFVPALAGPLLVARAERVPTRVALPALLTVEAALFATLAVAVVVGFNLALLLVLVALDGAVGLAARALLKASIVATTRPANLLREGNAVLTTVFTVCAALGPVLGGALIVVSSPEAALLANAASFALAALLLAMRAGVPEAHVEESTVSRRLREGLGYIRKRVALRRLLWTSATVVLLGAAIIPLEILLVTDTLGASEAAYGTVLAFWGIGAVAGSAALALARSPSLWALVTGSFVVYAASYLGMGTAGSVEVVCLFSFIGGTANGVEGFAVMTAIQEETADEQQARVSGLVEAVWAASMGAGFLLGGLIATLSSTRAVYVIAGFGILAAAAATLAPRRTPGTSAALGSCPEPSPS
jgi:MFS family permease